MRHRILIATTDAITLDAFLLPYARYFREFGWQVDAAAANTADYSSLNDAFDATHEIRWRRSPVDTSNLAGFLDVRRLLRSESYDLVHVHTPIASVITRAAARTMTDARRPRVIYTAHGFHFQDRWHGPSNAVFKAVERAAARWTDDLIVINQGDHDSALRLRLVPEQHLHLLPGIGIDVSDWVADDALRSRSESLRNSLSIVDGCPVVVVVAELWPRKGHRDLLSALARPQLREFHAVFAGAGPEEIRLRQQADELDLTERVHFLGFHRDVAEVILMASVMVLPSDREGLPRSVMEAMCLEVPVVAADVRGTNDLLEGGAGVLFPVGDVDAMADAIASVVTDSDLASALATEAAFRVPEFDLQPLLTEHKRIYLTSLGEPESM